MTTETQPWAVLVTGSREWSDAVSITRRLRIYDKQAVTKLPLLIHGAADGADSIAGELAEGFGWPTVPMPARWDDFGKSAGPMRNAAMLRVLLALGECGYQTVVEAFPGPKSKGTWDMVKRAERAGVTVHVTKGD